MTAATPQVQAPTLLELQRAAVRFGPVCAVSDASLSLRSGERLALVGANGSGKTTLLRLLHGLLPCADGRRLVGVSPRAGQTLRMAMLFQKPYFLSLSARANIRLGLWLHGLGAAARARRADEALERVGLLAQAKQRATTLSGGQQQRLALARAWALAPDVLFLDEPTASLDPSAKREVEQLVAELADEGLTLVMSSHNLGQVKRLATRVIYLDAGRLVVDLPVNEFFTGSVPAELAQFLKGELAWR